MMRTPTQQVLLDALTAVAARGDRCPSNDDLAELLGASSGGVASTAVKRLEQQGAIRVERMSGRRRRVTIVATGHATAEPPRRAGEA